MQPELDNVLENWFREDHSAAAYFRAIQPAIPASLVSADNYARILAVAFQVPGACALGGFYYEFVLGEAAAQADISFLVTPSQAGSGALAARQPVGTWRRDNAWFTLQRLASRWNQPDGPLKQEIESIWLEFDIHGDQPYAPSLFFTPVLQPQSRAWHMQRLRPLFALSRELGEAISKESLAAALTCLEQLPQQGKLAQIGCMLSRQPAPLRLCLHLQREAVLEYLEELGVHADLPRVADILDLFGAYDEEFFLHLDVLGEVQPKIGLDLNLTPAQSFPEVQVGKILEELCRRQLCTAAKREALEKLSGYTPMGANLINWPPALRRHCLQSQFGELSYFIRTISHFKVVIEPGRQLVAKAYMAVNHYWKKTTLPEKDQEP